MKGIGRHAECLGYTTTQSEACPMKIDTAFAIQLISPSPRPRRPLKIAQVAPLFKSIPPSGYGGTERVVSYLTEALVELGHHVTLFASGDSRSRARIVPVVERHLGLEACGLLPDWPRTRC